MLPDGVFHVRFADNLNDVLRSRSALQSNNELGWLWFTFRPSDFSTLEELLTQRFGKPEYATTKPWQSKGGVVAKQLNRGWHPRGLRIVLVAPADTIDEGSLTVVTDEYLKASEPEDDKRQQDRFKDL